MNQKVIAIFLAAIMLMSFLPLFFNVSPKPSNEDVTADYSNAPGFDSISGAHVNHKFDSISDGLDMAPKGIVSAYYLDVLRISGTPLEIGVTNAIQPDSLYNAKLTKTFLADYRENESWLELHMISPEIIAFPYWMDPTPYNGYQLLIHENGIYNAIGNPLIFGTQNKVEDTIDVLSGSAEKSNEFNHILKYVGTGSEFQHVTSDVPFASQHYLDFKILESGDYSRTSIYLNITNSTLENISNFKTNCTERNVAYDMTTDGNVTKVVVTGNFYIVAGEPIE